MWSKKTENTKKSDKEVELQKNTCLDVMFCYTQILKQIETNDNLIAHKELHADNMGNTRKQHFPRLPFMRSYRTIYTEQIDETNAEIKTLKQKNQQLHAEHDKLLSDLRQCIREGHLPVNATVTNASEPTVPTKTL